MPIDLKAAREVCAMATKGPWVPTLRQDHEIGVEVEIAAPSLGIRNSDGDGKRIVTGTLWYEAEANAAFIAYARTELPAALDEIERLRALLKDLSPHIERAGRIATVAPASVLARIDAALGGKS